MQSPASLSVEADQLSRAPCITTYIMQVAYCCDPIIEALLHCQAQHYLEFKLLQARCSFSCARRCCTVEHSSLAAIIAEHLSDFTSRHMCS